MNATLRKVNLTAHVLSSVGWLGAVVAFLALSVVGLRSAAPTTVRSCYVALNLIGLLVIVPSSVLAFMTGVIQALGTPWGLLRYYWVVVKLVLTIGATGLLLLHQFTAVAAAARRAAEASGGSLPNVGGFATQLTFDSGLAAVVLLITTILSVFKPWGRIRQARADVAPEGEIAAQAQVARTPLGVRIFVTAIGLSLATVVVLHIIGRGMHGHGM